MPDSDLGRDSRGILHPKRMQERVDFARFPPSAELGGLVDWLWAVAWQIPTGDTHEQPVLSHPCANISVGHSPPGRPSTTEVVARVYGVQTRVDRRLLRDGGWTVAAKTTPGGFGAFLARPAGSYTDAVTTPDEALGISGAALARRLAEAADQETRARLLDAALVDCLRSRDPARVAQAREVAAIASLAEHDRGIRLVADLARQVAVTERTLQRLFRDYVGVSPKYVVRRYRLIDAAERVRDGADVGWAQLAAELGYADQAHLIRDFRAATGLTPAAYASAQRG